MNAALLTPSLCSRELFSAGCASLHLDRHKWMNHIGISSNKGAGKLSNPFATRILCWAWQASQHELLSVELEDKLHTWVRPRLSSFPSPRSHAVINGSGLWLPGQMNTNEFRHPKERLQNLSSRHKVSILEFVETDVGDADVVIRGCSPEETCRLDKIQLLSQSQQE